MSPSNCRALLQGFGQVAASLERAGESWHCPPHRTFSLTHHQVRGGHRDAHPRVLCCSYQHLQLVGPASWIRHYDQCWCLRSETQTPPPDTPFPKLLCFFPKGEALNHHRWTKSGTPAKAWQKLSRNAFFPKDLKVVGFHQRGIGSAWRSVLDMISGTAAGVFCVLTGKR